MEKFWGSELGKIIGYGIHEHNSGVGCIRSYKDLIIKHPEKAEEYWTKMETHIKKCMASMDYVYTKLKEYHEKTNLENKI